MSYEEKKRRYFTGTEIVLWISSVILILVSFLIFGGSSYISLIASLIGVTALIFIAKGNPLGQLLTVIFSLLYGIISFSCSYYGEMLTYLGMTMPMAVFSLISWLKNPYNGNKSEVKVQRLKPKEYIVTAVLAITVTTGFYFVLKYFNTANLIPSTLSVTTSFMAVFLTFKRSPFYAFWYAANDVILIVLWSLAVAENISYMSVVVCFVVFFANDIYGFANWKKMARRQTTIQTVV